RTPPWPIPSPTRRWATTTCRRPPPPRACNPSARISRPRGRRLQGGLQRGADVLLERPDALEDPRTAVLPVRREVGQDLAAGRGDAPDVEDDLGPALDERERGEQLHDGTELPDRDEKHPARRRRLRGRPTANFRKRERAGRLVRADDLCLREAARR